MDNTKHSTFVRVVAILMVVVMIAPLNVSATTETISPRASYNLDSYNTYLYPTAFGKIQVWFSVTGVHYMDEIGVLTVKIYESTDNETWTLVKTYKHDTTSGMLIYDEVFHSGHVDYQGTIGRYYKAYVTIWAGKDGDGDTRYMWTDIQKASLFAG